MEIKSKIPTLAFATMCKNEGDIIRKTLDSLTPYISYLVYVDTESTDNSIEEVQRYMDETGIPGEIHVEPFEGMGKTKSKMMKYAKGKADYILHIDGHMHLQGDLDLNELLSGKDAYRIVQRRGGAIFDGTCVLKGDLNWRLVGASHTVYKCDNRPDGYTLGKLGNCWIQHHVVGKGARAKDPEKYKKDAIVLTKQFWETLEDDPDNMIYRSVFYTAQSWFDYGDFKEALKWYTLYTKLKDGWIEELYESYVRMATCKIKLERDFDEVRNNIDDAIKIHPDRAESYVIFARYAFYEMSKPEIAYQYMKKAVEIDLENAVEKYVLFVNKYMYAPYIYDDFSVICYHTGNFEEGMHYLQQIINDPQFSHLEKHLRFNEKWFKKSLNLI